MAIRHSINKLFVAALLVGLPLACRPPITFNQPQPPNGKSLSSFPGRLQGTYLSRDHISIITISDSAIVRNYNFDIKLRRDSLGKSYKLNGDTLITMSSGKAQPVLIIEDTVYGGNPGIDTIFHISATNVLKKFRGHYFLNKQYVKDQWMLQRLSLSSGVLTLSYIDDSVHMDQLRELTETPADTICSNFKLSQKQFDKFMSNNNFDQTEQFTRIKGRQPTGNPAKSGG